MSRLKACFDRLKSESKTALIPYVMTADPHPDVTLPLMHAMVEAGASIILEQYAKELSRLAIDTSLSPQRRTLIDELLDWPQQLGL